MASSPGSPLPSADARAQVDTIAAIATAAGPGAIGIVRISGPRALRVAQRLCPGLEAPEPRRAIFGEFTDVEGNQIDEGIAIYFPPGRSYTGDEVVELQGHGGMASRLLLAAALSAGARAAQPGEFTFRAYAAGRLDLVRAEAVGSLIAAESEAAARQATRVLGGSVSRRVGDLQQMVLRVQALLEGMLDLPEECDAPVVQAEAERVLSEVGTELDALRRSHRSMARLSRRAKVVLVGPANAGKSSLINAILGQPRALVDSEPGTTRDAVPYDGEIDGAPICWVDTAGWRSSALGVEALGIARGKEEAAAAELVLWVCDGRAFVPAPNPGWLLVATKADAWGPEIALPPGAAPVSALTGQGLAELSQRVGSALETKAVEGHPEGVAHRQADAFDLAGHHARGAAQWIRAQPELAAAELAAVQVQLERVLGSGERADVVKAVFARFCVGK